MLDFIRALSSRFVMSAAPTGGAAGYPNRPIRMLVSGPTGNPGNITGLLIAEKLRQRWGQPVNVEYHPQAVEVTAEAAPDGYTMVLVGGSHYIKPALYRKLPYDPLNDFVPLSLLVSGFNILAVPPSLPAGSVSEVIAYAKANPGRLKYASGGIGTPSHLAAELFKSMAGVDIGHVTYKGHEPADAALLEGKEVQLMFDAMLTAMPHVKAGKLKALGVTTPKRASILPDVPAIAETVPGYDMSPAMGMLAPAGTPRDIVLKLSQEFAQILHLPDVKAALQKDGGEPVGSSPEEFEAYVQAAFAKWAKVARDAGIPVAEAPPASK